MGAIRTFLGMGPVILLAWWFFGFSVYSMGLALAAFFASLILFGWAIGIAVCGLIMRYGMGAESAAWGTMFLILPVAAVYYPVTILPHRSEEHTSELQSLMRISYAVFCLKKKHFLPFTVTT